MKAIASSSPCPLPLAHQASRIMSFSHQAFSGLFRLKDYSGLSEDVQSWLPQRPTAKSSVPSAPLWQNFMQGFKDYSRLSTAAHQVSSITSPCLSGKTLDFGPGTSDFLSPSSLVNLMQSSVPSVPRWQSFTNPLRTIQDYPMPDQASRIQHPSRSVPAVSRLRGKTLEKFASVREIRVKTFPRRPSSESRITHPRQQDIYRQPAQIGNRQSPIGNALWN